MTTVKPIMVGSETLTNLENRTSRCLEEETLDQVNHYDTAQDVLFVAARLRKEVSRHKKTKRKNKDLQRLFAHESGHGIVLLAQVNELKQELVLEREQIANLIAENERLKLELAERMPRGLYLPGFDTTGK